MSICDAHDTKIVGKCSSCMKSQVQKDAEYWVALVHAMGQDEDISADLANVEHEVLPIATDEWCCMSRVLSLQQDFQSEKLCVQSIIEAAGHVYLFLP
jgi:hypothetical protein